MTALDLAREHMATYGYDGYRLEDLPERIRVHIIVNPDTGCWEFQGRTTKDGYAYVSWQRRMQGVHRVAYMILVGPIPTGLTLDHVRARGCRSKVCCWPAHLEPVTRAENNKRRGAVRSTRADLTRGEEVECIRGHIYTPENTRYTAEGWRVCRTCQRDWGRERHREKAREERGSVAPPPAERTHCAQGHPYDEANTHWYQGHRICKACRQERDRQRKRGARSGGKP